jgi:hypothetical protein
MQRPFLATAAIALFALTGAACTSQAAKEPPAAVQQAAKAPPGGAYQKVSDLVALPEFIPGLGALYVQPGGAENVVDVDMYYNAGHPGVEQPHYHVVLWHVPESDAKLQ